MVSDAFNSLVLLTGYWPCPKELQRFPFFHQPIVPMVDNTNCWFCCLSILAHIYSRRTMILRRTLVRKECAKLFWMQPYPLFSKLTIFTFLVKKNCFAISTGKFLVRMMALVKTIASHENDLWLKCAKNDAMSLQRGELDHAHMFVGPKMSSNMANENDEWLNMHFPGENVQSQLRSNYSIIVHPPKG